MPLGVPLSAVSLLAEEGGRPPAGGGGEGEDEAGNGARLCAVLAGACVCAVRVQCCRALVHAMRSPIAVAPG